MNVKTLREFIKDLPDDTQIVVPGGDHSYQRASAGLADAVNYYPKRQKSGELGEYYGNPNEIDFNQTPDALIVKVLVIDR